MVYIHGVIYNYKLTLHHQQKDTRARGQSPYLCNHASILSNSRYSTVPCLTDNSREKFIHIRSVHFFVNIIDLG